jgi:hypothetical protein
MTDVVTTRIDNFVCPACGEVMRQVTALDGVVKGWCRTANKEIKVNLNEISTQSQDQGENAEPQDYLGSLKYKRAKVLKEVVSAREDGDLKENSAYHAAREQLSILDDKILKEEDRIRRENQV